MQPYGWISKQLCCMKEADKKSTYSMTLLI